MSEKKEKGSKRKKSKEYMMNLLSTGIKTSFDAISVASPVDKKLIFCNDAFLKKWKIRGDYHNLQYIDCFDTDPDVLKKAAQATMKGGWSGELRAKTMDGKTFPVIVTSSPVVDKDGKTIGLLSIFKDITDRKKVEEELKGSEERLRVLFECAPDGIYLMDLKGNFTDGNKAAEELIGYKKEELTGKNMAKVGVLPKSQIPKSLANLAKNAMGKPTGPDEFTLIRKDGNKVEVEIRTYPVKIKGKTLVLGIARDITERKKADEELKKSKEELETKVKDLERFSKLSVGRELKMIELKKAIRELEEQLKEKSK